MKTLNEAALDLTAYLFMRYLEHKEATDSLIDEFASLFGAFIYTEHGESHDYFLSVIDDELEGGNYTGILSEPSDGELGERLYDYAYHIMQDEEEAKKVVDAIMPTFRKHHTMEVMNADGAGSDK